MDRSVAFAIDDVKEDVDSTVLKLHEDELHFGFLKTNHIYSSTVELPFAVKKVKFDDGEFFTLKNTEISPKGDNSLAKFEIVVGDHQGKFSSTLHVETDEGQVVAVPVHANILGSEAGHPLLRPGIHATGDVPIHAESIDSDVNEFEP